MSGDNESLTASSASVLDGDDACCERSDWKRAFCVYMPLGAIDVLANYLVVLAFQHTDVASVMLLDCWAIPVSVAVYVSCGVR